MTEVKTEKSMLDFPGVRGSLSFSRHMQVMVRSQILGKPKTCPRKRMGNFPLMDSITKSKQKHFITVPAFKSGSFVDLM